MQSVTKLVGTNGIPCQISLTGCQHLPTQKTSQLLEIANPSLLWRSTYPALILHSSGGLDPTCMSPDVGAQLSLVCPLKAQQWLINDADRTQARLVRILLGTIVGTLVKKKEAPFHQES